MSSISFKVIDIEASALVGGYPIAIGIVRADGAMLHALIQPEAEWLEFGRWDPNAQHLHGISLDKLKSEGRQAAEIVEEINQRFSGWLHSDAPSHDLRWLQELRDAAEIELRANIVAKEVETTLRELAEANETPRAKINEIFNLERATHNHHALHDAAAWVAVRESITRWETEEPTAVFTRWKNQVDSFLSK